MDEIRVADVLDGRWAAWFGGLQLRATARSTKAAQDCAGQRGYGSRIARLGAEGFVERHYVVLESEDRGLGAVGEAELGQDAGHVALHRLL
jgi:hypothetical protein